MATGYGSWAGGDDYRAKVVASVSGDTSTSTSATVTANGYLVSNHGYASNWESSYYSSVKGSSSSGSRNLSFGNGATVSLNSKSLTIQKTHSAQNITCKAQVNSYAGSSTASTTVTISALASRKISYNANGGSGAPASQTKWWGESLKLSSTTPTRSGYSFLGWSTSSNGSVEYKPGASYSVDSSSNTTLYAIWRQTYKDPSIISMRVYRCDSYYAQADDGIYAYLKLGWKVNQSSTTPSSISIRYKCLSISDSWHTAYVKSGLSLPGTSGTANTALFSNQAGTTLLSFNSNYSYTIEVTFKDSNNHSAKTSRTLSPAYFIFDIKPGGRGVGGIGIGHSADISGVCRIGYDVQIDGYTENGYEHGNFSCVDSRLPVSSNSASQLSDAYGNGLFFYGSGFSPTSGNPIYKSHGYIRGLNLASGNRGVQVEAQREVNGTRKTNALNLTIDSSGNAHATLGGTGIFMCHGNVGQEISVPANSYGEYNITFNHTYSSPPHVFPALYSTTSTSMSTFGSLSVAVYSTSNTGAVIRIYNNTSTARSPGLHWFAIGD